VNFKLSQVGAIAIGVGSATCISAVLVDTRAFFLGYLVIAVTISAIPAGALAVLLLSYLVRGPWMKDLHSPLAAAALTAPLAGVLFLPVLAGLPWLYPWVEQPAGAPGSFKSIFLTPTFYAGRSLIYFTAWTVLALWARWAWGDATRMVRVASIGLIVYALTASFAGVDWLKSLNTEFHSSIYGLMFLTFQVLAGFAFALAIALWPADASTHRYGAILLSAILMWAYNHAMQYIIVWSGNIPKEVTWYAVRETGTWSVALWSLAMLQFVLPFFVLLSERERQARRCLLILAMSTVALRLLEAIVLVLPDTNANPWATGLAIGGALLIVGSLWGTGFAIVVRRVRDSVSEPLAGNASVLPVTPERV
jgi:hypothetical protein